MSLFINETRESKLFLRSTPSFYNDKIKLHAVSVRYIQLQLDISEPKILIELFLKPQALYSFVLMLKKCFM